MLSFYYLIFLMEVGPSLPKKGQQRVGVIHDPPTFQADLPLSLLLLR